MVFHFGPDFHDLQVSRILELLGALNAAKRCFILFLIICIFRSVGFPNLEVD